MDYNDFLRHIESAGLKLHEFAALIGMNRVSISNYAKAGEVPAHLAIIAVLLGEMKKHNIDFHEPLSKIDIAPKKPRGAGLGKFGGNKN